MNGILRAAFARLSFRFVLMQVGLAAIVSLLFAAWLHIPDSGIIAVLATVVLAALMLMLAFYGEASILRRLARSGGRSLLPGAIVLLLAAAVWLGWSAWLDHFNDADLSRVAGFANSRFPHSLRSFLTFQNLYRWLGWVLLASKWLGAGILLAVAVPFAQSLRPVRAGVRVLFCFSYWVTLAIIAFIITLLTKGLVEWTPGRGLRVEAISLVLRLGVVAIVDAALVCFLLTLITALAARVAERQAIPEGTPETSQPRSDDIP